MAYGIGLLCAERVEKVRILAVTVTVDGDVIDDLACAIEILLPFLLAVV